MRKAFCLLTASLLQVGCAEDGSVLQLQTTDRATLDRMYQEIFTMVQDRSCRHSAECAAIALGSKPCGGPWRYLVYSNSTVDKAELEARAEDLATYQAKYNEEHHIVSDCALATSADPACADGVCVDRNESP